MSYYKPATAKVIPLFPSGPAAPLAPRPASGVGIDFGGGVSINTDAIAQKIVDWMWPPVDKKISEVEGRVTKLASELIPKAANQAVDVVKARLPELVGVAMPIVEKEANKLVGTYETRYRTMLHDEVGKYVTPALVVAGVVGVLVTAASIKILKQKTPR